MIKIIRICICTIFGACFCLDATISVDMCSDRDWEKWEEQNVAEVIHEFWVHSPSEINHRQTLAQLVKNLYLPGERFLEAGCGSGLVYKELIPNVMKNSCYFGIDITQKMLDIAHRNYPNGSFAKDDLYNLSFEDNSFEIVAAFEVLGHIRNIEVPIREMLRVASRLVVFTVWTGNSTRVTEERFGNLQFIHTTFSNADILNAIDVNYEVSVIPLSKYTTAYIINLR